MLSECEGEVRKKYPYMHEAAKTRIRPVYQGSDYGDAINLMMSIRPEIMSLRDANDAILAEIDSRLK